MNLVELLARRALEHPQRPALVDRRNGRDRVVSFGELSQRVSAGSTFLKQLGLSRGQVVLVFHPVSIELYEFLLAAFHRGLRVMLADPSAGREFLTDCCDRLPPDAFFGSWKAQCLRLAVPGLRGIRRSIVCGPWFPGATIWRTACGNEPINELPDDEPALVTFTSGSTGKPKAAVRTHGFLLAQHRALAESLDFQSGEVDLITLPVFVLANLASGMTSVLAATDLARPGSPDAAAVRSQCERFGVTRCAASPAFFEGLLRSPDGMPRFEKVFTGGAPVFPDLLRRLSDTLPHAVIESVYGSTEAEPIAHFPADAWTAETEAITRRGGGLCAGPPVREIGLRIIADHWGKPLGPMSAEAFSQLTVNNGQAGEIVVTGDHVLRGYLEGIGDEETKIPVGGTVWHRTGDAGWMDAEGRLWLLGRCAEKLPQFAAPGGLPGDALRYPFAVECALRPSFPQVRMAALDWRGKRVLVVGKPCEPAEAGDIRGIAAEFGIDELIHLENLPLDRRHNAKIDYPALRKRLGNR